MNDRLKAMRRIAAVQAQQKRLAEWALATAVQRQTQIEAAQRDLAGFVDGGILVGRLASEALLQAQRLARRGIAAETLRQEQAVVLGEAERRLRLSERSVDRLAAEVEADQERRRLEALIEALVAPPATDER